MFTVVDIILVISLLADELFITNVIQGIHPITVFRKNNIVAFIFIVVHKFEFYIL